jgi:hypothetical protein
MNFKEALSKLKKSPEFKRFKKEHKDSYLCTGFFIIDSEGTNGTTQLNFQMRNEKIAAFSVGEDINVKIEDLMIREKIPKLKESINKDIDDLQGILKRQIKEKDIRGKISKVMAILTNDGKNEIWNVTCFLELMQIINIHVDANSGKVLKSEKMALDNFFKKPADYVG